MKIARWLPALILSLTLASSASATHGGIHPKFRTQTVYFHCTGETPLQQANWAAAQLGEAGYASWDTAPPAGSVADGEGCGAADIGGRSFSGLDAVFQGPVTGNLRDLTVRIHDFVLNSDRNPSEPVRMRVYAEIDSADASPVALFPGGTLEAGGYAGRSFSVTPTRSSTNFNVTDLFEFTITNIGFARDVIDASGNVIDVETGGAALEEDNGSKVYELTLWIGLEPPAGTAPHETGTDLFVWDTTEVPSGITFNPVSPAEATVEADLPDLG